MKPNDKAIEAALLAAKTVLRNNEITIDSAIFAAVTAAYAAQFQSEDYAGFVKELRAINTQWRLLDVGKAAFHDRLRINNYEELCTEAADAIEALLAERDALKKAVEAEQSMTNLGLGPFLKKVRQEKQMTLRAVEEATAKEISNAYLSQLESGKIANPSPHVLYALSLVFGVAYETLMERAGYVMPAPNRLAPVDDEALVEIALQKFKRVYNDTHVTREAQQRTSISAAIADIRPHIEAAERERCANVAEGNYERLEPASQESAHYKNGRLAAAAAIRSWK